MVQNDVTVTVDRRRVTDSDDTKKKQNNHITLRRPLDDSQNLLGKTSENLRNT